MHKFNPVTERKEEFMFKKIKAFFSKYTEEILTAIASLFFGTTLILTIFTIALVVMTNDLVNVIDMRNAEIEELKAQNTILYQKVDDIVQTYEDSVPKLQYDAQIQYYESVIDELKTQCQLDETR